MEFTAMIVVNREALEELIRAWTSAQEALIQERNTDWQSDYQELKEEEEGMRRRLIIGTYDPDWGIVPQGGNK